jgi:hypothetical protein
VGARASYYLFVDELLFLLSELSLLVSGGGLGGLRGTSIIAPYIILFHRVLLRPVKQYRDTLIEGRKEGSLAH